jgi:DNA-directed RNA polymerase subunit L
MEIEKISDNNYKFIFTDETHTIIHMLQQELLKIKCVEIAGYNQPHPLETCMILHIKTSDRNPKEVLHEAIDNLVGQIDNIRSLC